MQVLCQVQKGFLGSTWEALILPGTVFQCNGETGFQILQNNSEYLIGLMFK